MAMNVVYIRPGPYPGAKDAIGSIDAFGLFFNDEILNKVLLRTNEKIAQLREKYKIKDCTVSDTNLCELKALLGLIFLSATLKNNHLTTDVLFDPNYSGDRYKAIKICQECKQNFA
ncbi:uncharacterized protein LOC128866745 isoform X2 [Anastrepha ludens]|uniref:uncharacterized protein LOC128866745 isoform X2 n=1 Tax=Anastrepha ludens TaxID=28586 RepID=UPI0023B1F514|nr:uncharacterized protein LOC128866745 isoform X2 [Anastrepha ludens]